jgi:hypothetical protein
MYSYKAFSLDLLTENTPYPSCQAKYSFLSSNKTTDIGIEFFCHFGCDPWLATFGAENNVKEDFRKSA